MRKQSYGNAMNSTNRKRYSIFYGSHVLLAAWLGGALNIMVVIVYSFGVFFDALMQEFSWSRSEISLAFSLFFLAATIMLPVVGYLTDLLGARRIIMTSVLIFGLSLVSFYFFTTNLWYFYAVFLLIGAASGGTSSVPYFTVIGRWFTRRRGLALGVANSGQAVGALIMPYLAFLIVDAVGWREAFAVIGVSIVLVTVLVVAMMLQESPEAKISDQNSVGATRVNEQNQYHQHIGNQYGGMSANKALKTRHFWVIGFAFFLSSVTTVGCLAHFVPMLTDLGLTLERAAIATSILGGTEVLGRLVTGYWLDRVFAPRVIAILWLAGIGGVSILLIGPGGGVLFLSAALLGMAWGGEGDVLAYLVIRYFGMREFGRIYSRLLAINLLGGVVGPLALGLTFDSMGTYQLGLGVFVLLMLMGIVLVTRLGKYPKS